jgi:lauroyl/myristoyl acyltransferase
VSRRDRITDAGFAVAWAAAQHLPDGMTRRLAQAAADGMWRRQSGGVLQLRANLARVLGPVSSEELDAVTRDAVRRYLRYWQEAFALPSWSAERINSSFVVTEGLEHLDAAMNSGTGAMMALPHMGNWDLAGAWATMRYGRLTTVAERLRPEKLFDRFVSYREGLGMEVIALGEPDVTSRLARRLKEGGLVCLLADRDLQGRGVDVQFFGEKASMPPGPAALSVLTGAPLMTVSTWHDPGVTHARINPPLAIPSADRRSEVVERMTQQLADEFQEAIAQRPADWHMMQRVWHADLTRRS